MEAQNEYIVKNYRIVAPKQRPFTNIIASSIFPFHRIELNCILKDLQKMVHSSLCVDFMRNELFIHKFCYKEFRFT